MIERAHREVELRVAAQRDGDRRRLGVEVARIGDDDDVRAHLVGVRIEEVRERARPVFLLALDEQHDAESEVVGSDRLGDRPQRGDVRHDPGLVVCRAAPVDATVAHRRFERRRLPHGVVAGRLHVMVRVQHDRRMPRLRAAHGEHARLAELRSVVDRLAMDVDGVEQARSAGELRNTVGASHELGLVEGGPGDPGDLDEHAEVAGRGGESARDGLEERFLVGSDGAVSCRGTHAGNLRGIFTPPTRGD